MFKCRFMLRVVFFVLFLLVIHRVEAQETESHFYRNESKNERFDAGSPIISGILFPSYTPEMMFNIRGGALLTFKTRRNNDYLTHSDIPVLFSLSPDGGFYCSGMITTFWFDDRFKFTFDASFTDRNDNYWGVGIENATSVKKGDQTTKYHQKYLSIKPAFSFKISKNIYAGLVLNRNQMEAGNITDLMTEDPAILTYGTSIISNGLGIKATFDTRDIPTYPTKGILIGAEALFYVRKFDSDNTFKTFEFDYRQYHHVIREGSVLAWQAHTRFATGNVPWSEMSQLGSINDLRGYYYGQYRDRSSAYAIVEYRHTFLKKASEQLSRHSVVFWMGAGTIYEKLTKINKGILSTGLGYRYEVQPHRTIRIDLGFGTEYAGLFIGFCEAF
jgi:outer membrane protein assembly factor BamA